MAQPVLQHGVAIHQPKPLVILVRLWPQLLTILPFLLFFKTNRYRWVKNGFDFLWQSYDDRISQQPGRGTLVITTPRDEDIGQSLF